MKKKFEFLQVHQKSKIIDYCYLNTTSRKKFRLPTMCMIFPRKFARVSKIGYIFYYFRTAEQEIIGDQKKVESSLLSGR